MQRRPTIEDFLLHSSGRCGLTDVVDFLSDFVLKSEEDKKEFSKNMFSLVTSFPEEAVCHRLLPVLLTPPVMGDPSILPIWDTILIPKSGSDDDDSVSGFLSEDCYKQEILPEIIELLHSREKNIRTILLKKFEFYVNLFPLEDLKELVLPEIVVGIQEKDEDIVVATLRSLAFLVPLLGADVVIGTSRSTLFTDSLPASAVDIGSTESPPMEPAECKENPPGEPGEEDTIPVSDSSLEDDLEQLSIEDSPSTPYDQSISVKTSQS
jgi:SCY1-like protein 3